MFQFVFELLPYSITFRDNIGQFVDAIRVLFLCYVASVHIGRFFIRLWNQILDSARNRFSLLSFEKHKRR